MEKDGETDEKWTPLHAAAVKGNTALMISWRFHGGDSTMGKWWFNPGKMMILWDLTRENGDLTLGKMVISWDFSWMFEGSIWEW